ncbi:phytanoyl-CoA dioxygenase [Rhizobium sp. SYY.PMSO]|uniref:phytanoyl-CoA dioxygenase n=1 Tax=Rhizobium sp. SYY.PMSO TaxID=3382192 RepID=UPI00398FB42B
MPSKKQYPAALSSAQLDEFIERGFVRIEHAFSSDHAAQARAIMWRDLPCSEHDPASWRFPVVRLAGYGGEPFRTIANMPILHSAFDQLVGRRRWLPRDGLGTFPVRFPHPDDPGDAGWHVDLSFPGEDGDHNEQNDFSAWRVNVTSRGRALLTLFLFSDVGENDAPTRIRVGSHQEMARYLAPAGNRGCSHMMLEGVAADCPEALATGEAGTVYICHPFLIHAAQKHRGVSPRFIAQPSIGLAEPYQLDRPDNAYCPVEIAIRRALGKE